MHPQQGCARPLDRKAGRSRYDLGEIFRAHIDAFRDRHILSPYQAQVVRAICACRTAQLGGHLDVCLDCGYKRPAYNSCRNRHCPKCQALDQHRWLERRLERILPVAYFHVVFTLPGKLASVGLRNRRLVYELLFRAAAETLLTLGKDPQRLGALLGITMVLHTWTRDLRFHPHVHAIVTGGGLSPDDQRWLSTGDKYLFPVKLLSSLYRGKFLGHLARAHKDARLDLPAELAEDGGFDRLLSKLYAKDWIVYAKRPFAGPEQVFSYLGRYTHRVGLSNHRILDVTEKAITLATRNQRPSPRSSSSVGFCSTCCHDDSPRSATTDSWPQPTSTPASSEPALSCRPTPTPRPKPATQSPPSHKPQTSSYNASPASTPRSVPPAKAPACNAFPSTPLRTPGLHRR